MKPPTYYLPPPIGKQHIVHEPPLREYKLFVLMALAETLILYKISITLPFC